MKPLLEVLQSGAAYLTKKGIDEARLNMEHLLAHVLQCRRMDLYLRFSEVLREPELETLRGLLKRRGEGEPLQHLLGTVEFYDSEFVSDHRALVPRPETERLVEMIVEQWGKEPPARVLDMATGSGCIGLSLAKAWPKSAVVLADISEDALELARLNCSRLKLDERVRLVRSDLFEKVDGAFDLIVANLPYIPRGELAALSREVRRDPMLALDGGESGMEIIERFITASKEHLNDGAWIAQEVHHDQGEPVALLCQSAGFVEVTVRKDLADIGRFVFAKWQHSAPTS
jgi:release factor glutamine methyltransferase